MKSGLWCVLVQHRICAWDRRKLLYDHTQVTYSTLVHGICFPAILMVRFSEILMLPFELEALLQPDFCAHFPKLYTCISAIYRCWSCFSLYAYLTHTAGCDSSIHNGAPEQCTNSLFSCNIMLAEFAGFSFCYLFGFVLQLNLIVQKGRSSFLVIKSETVAKYDPGCKCFSPMTGSFLLCYSCSVQQCKGHHLLWDQWCTWNQADLGIKKWGLLWWNFSSVKYICIYT